MRQSLRYYTERRRIREHLTGHELFTVDRVKHWIRTKMRRAPGKACREALLVAGLPAGVLYSLMETDEIAIVIDENQWGLGPRIFRDVMDGPRCSAMRRCSCICCIPGLNTDSLRRIARKVYTTELLGDRYTTYELMVV